MVPDICRNATLMDEAIQIHDTILRQVMQDHFGHEVGRTHDLIKRFQIGANFTGQASANHASHAEGKHHAIGRCSRR